MKLAIHGGPPVRPASEPQWPIPTPGISRRVDATISSGLWGIGGAEIPAFEAWLSDELGVARTLAVVNGTQALELALRVAGVSRGDEVLVPALTFVSSASAVTAVGARPVPVDVSPDSLLLDVDDAVATLSPRTRAIIPVHLAGLPCDMQAVCDFAEAHDLTVVEDAAQAIGASVRGRPVGAWGELAAFSFQSAKILPCGEGGALCIRDENAEWFRRADLLRNCGRPTGSSHYRHSLPGSNLRMTELQAAVLMAQAPELSSRHKQRARALAQIRKTLESCQTMNLVPGETGYQHDSANYMVTVLVEAPGSEGEVRRNSYLDALNGEGIGVKPIYPVFYDTPALAEFARRCPAAESAAASAICLPHPYLYEDEVVDSVCQAFRKVDQYFQSSLGLR